VDHQENQLIFSEKKEKEKKERGLLLWCRRKNAVVTGRKKKLEWKTPNEGTTHQEDQLFPIL